jgi:hypothetical protein
VNLIPASWDSRSLERFGRGEAAKGQLPPASPCLCQGCPRWAREEVAVGCPRAVDAAGGAEEAGSAVLAEPADGGAGGGRRWDVE